MSSGERNVATVLALYDAVNRRDEAAACRHLDADFVWDLSRSRGPARGVYRGREAVLQAMASFGESWASTRWQAEEIRARGDDEVLALNHARYRGTGSGIDIEARGAQLWFFRDGRAIAMRMHQRIEDVPEYPAEPPI